MHFICSFFFFFPWLLTACAGAEISLCSCLKALKLGVDRALSPLQGVLGGWACPLGACCPNISDCERQMLSHPPSSFVDEDTEAAGALFYSLFNKYLWKTYYVQGMVLSSSNTAISERDKNSDTRGAYVSEERGNEKYMLPPGVMSAMGK